jgi:hypothetical protein
MARKIEKAMNKAIANGDNWKQDNTAVVEADGISVVMLYGNKISEIGDNFIRLFDGGWQTNTTKSRLNAIIKENSHPGEGVFQKAGKWFVRVNRNGDYSTIPFRDGMLLE